MTPKDHHPEGNTNEAMEELQRLIEEIEEKIEEILEELRDLTEAQGERHFRNYGMRDYAPDDNGF